MATTDFTKAGDQVQVSIGGVVVDTYDRTQSSYSFASPTNNTLYVYFRDANNNLVNYTVALASLRVSGAGSAPADQAAALTALALVWADSIPTLQEVATAGNTTTTPITAAEIVTPIFTGATPATPLAISVEGGLGATATIEGTNLAGLISITTGTGATTGDLAVISMADGFNRVGYVLLAPANDNAAGIRSWPANTTTTFTVRSVTPADNTEYHWNYLVVATP